MRRAIFMVLSLALLGTWACGSDNQSQAVAGAAKLGFAQAPFDATVFDTLTWSSHDQLLAYGESVFNANCKKCHGPTGAGEGGYIYGGQSVEPPSFLVLNWRFANDPIGLRRYIYSGSVGGMPYWGLTGADYRDIDAVADYIVEVLRPTYGETQATR
jgi:mono/diheme cytochrome c family protein